ncbi:MAG: adenylyl-sulfate kinase [Rhodospirillales bacterium]|nr:adenylyl-sulfate kinase [Rhodospirillales bacterium]
MDSQAENLFQRLLDALGIRGAGDVSDGRDALPLRMPVQDVDHAGDRRIVKGRIETGRVSVGDRVLFSPSNVTARVAGIEAKNAPTVLTEAAAGQSIGITLEEQLVIEPGETLSHENRPPVETDVFRARLLWLGHTPLGPGRRCTLRLGTAAADVEVQSIERFIEPHGSDASGAAHELTRDGLAEVVLRSRSMLALDAFTDNPRTGRFVLADETEIVGVGLIGMEGYPDQRSLITGRSSNVTVVDHGVSRAARARRNRHAGGVIWLTGLSGAGKSTLVIAAEDHLFRKGYQVYALDGDNVRHGLNATLGFSPEDRAENIRRVGEVAALFADAGFIVLTAFISPYRADRARARAAAERVTPRGFHEVYIRAPLEVCEARDPRGLYERARAGEIPDFTGISAPYEPPERPELTVDTGDRSVEQSLRALIDHIERYFALTGEAPPEG